MLTAVQSHQNAMVYVGPWISASHRDPVHYERVMRARRLRRCDDLGQEVARAQDTLRRELEKWGATQKRLIGATFSDLFFYLKTFPIHLGILTEALTNAEAKFDAARARYNQECLGQDAPVYVHEPLEAKEDVLRVAIQGAAELAAKGATYVYDHPWRATGAAGISIFLVLVPEIIPAALAF